MNGIVHMYVDNLYRMNGVFVCIAYRVVCVYVHYVPI